MQTKEIQDTLKSIMTHADPNEIVGVAIILVDTKGTAYSTCSSHIGQHSVVMTAMRRFLDEQAKRRPIGPPRLVRVK